MSAVRQLAVGLLMVATVLPAPAAAQKEPRKVAEEFSAILTNISNVGAAGLTPVTIRITRWTPDDENDRLLKTLRDDGQDAFLRALLDVKSVGSIATPTSLRYDFFYAREMPADGAGRRIMLISDRPMRISERLGGGPGRDYPFTVIELRLDNEGNGDGTLAQMVQLRLVGNFLGIENLANSPMKLNQVKKVK
ncbi:MAG TPA: hypothetical protein VJ813_16275 [Vicinamibacterales bacterium]|nr:hypothetical protein [Vicinamibacterales bacterium]